MNHPGYLAFAEYEANWAVQRAVYVDVLLHQVGQCNCAKIEERIRNAQALQFYKMELQISAQVADQVRRAMAWHEATLAEQEHWERLERDRELGGG